MVNPEFIHRIQTKTISNQLLNALRVGYGYPPAIAESIVKTVKETLTAPLSQASGLGTISHLATPISAGAGTKLKDVPLKTIHLTLMADEDVESLREHGIAALRQVKIMRMSEEAYEQGALLSIEDFAILLCSSVRTVEYDLKELREKGLAIRTRGQVKGIGLRASHRSWIVGLYLDGYEMDDLIMRTKHTEQSIENYIETFKRVVIMTERGMPMDEIGSSLGVSKWLVEEYLRLIQKYDGSSRLAGIRTMGVPITTSKKGGVP